jgi:hypothetical protein
MVIVAGTDPMGEQGAIAPMQEYDEDEINKKSNSSFNEHHEGIGVKA